MKQCISYLDFKKAYDPVRRGVLYNILIWVWYAHETGKVNTNVSEWNLWHSLGRQAFVWRVSN